MAGKVLLVKNMVCHRCILAVEDILNKLHIAFDKISFGEIYLKEAITPPQQETLKERLHAIGFELIDNRQTGLVEKIKKFTMLKARNDTDDKESAMNLSGYLSAKLHHEYTYLSSLFSAVEGRTIENFFIEQRIEKAKELIVYGELTLAEIAYALDYSSAAHLSAQFKKITGLTPTHFRQIGSLKRKSIDKL
jgi:AraC-like DNA-binding protein